MSKEELTFEKAAARIDEIVQLLEKGDAPLDKSLTLFEEGVGLIKTCGAMLDTAEQKITELQGNTISTKEIIFDDDDDDDDE
ncbi:MAG: exodeoxyribonuclease VII small subunit [Oscillospiraceae bacterium]|nr:exodeoxyribonuclease VII small subunit [Oscillospiraceae bacterium]